jgi:hypothetical protein
MGIVAGVLAAPVPAAAMEQPATGDRPTVAMDAITTPEACRWITGALLLDGQAIGATNRFSLIDAALGAPLISINLATNRIRPFNSATLGLTLNWLRAVYNDGVTDGQSAIDRRDVRHDHRVAVFSPALAYIALVDETGTLQHGVSGMLHVLRWDTFSLGVGMAYHTAKGAFGLSPDNLSWILPVSANWGPAGL